MRYLSDLHTHIVTEVIDDGVVVVVICDVPLY
jgi:hypothetical protein